MSLFHLVPGNALMRGAVIALALHVVADSSSGQPLAVDPDFAPTLIDQLSPGSRVRVQLLPGGGYLATGPFTFAGTAPASGVARLLADGANDPDFSFGGMNTTSGLANADEGTIPLSDGRVLVYYRKIDANSGDWNTQIDGYLATGAVDPSFEVLMIPNGYILNVVPERNGGVLLAGLIPEINGVACEGVARITSDGRLDVGFFRAMAGPTSIISSLVLAADGSLTASGYRSSPASDLNFVRRYLANSVLDTLLQPEVGSTPGSPPRLLASQSNGRTIVAGNPAVRWNPDGTVDASFQPSLPPNSSITAAVAYDDGRLLVQYEPLPSASQPAGLSSVILLAADGSILTQFRSLLGETGAIHIHHVAAMGEVLLRGTDIVHSTIVASPGPGLEPTPVTQVSFRNPRFTPLATNGSLGTTFRPALGVSGAVARVLGASGGRVYVSGDFDLYDGVPVRGLIRLEADGTPDVSFLAPGTLELPTSLGTTITTPVARYALEHVMPDDRLLVSLQLRSPSLARTRALRLLADGSLDSSLALDSAFAASSTHPLDVAADGRIVAVRAIVDPSVVPPRLTTQLALYAADGAHLLDYPTAFSPVAPTTLPPGASVFHIVRGKLLSDDRLMVVGSFDRVNGVPRPGLARLHADGSLDESYSPEVVPGTALEDFNLLAGGRVLANSREVTGPSWTVTATRLRADGRVDPAFHTVPNTAIVRPFEQADGSILDGGLGLRRLLPDGAPDRNVEEKSPTGPRPQFMGAVQSADGSIIAGGRFTTVRGADRTGLVRLVPVDTPGITRQPTPRTTIAGETAHLEIAVGNLGPVSIQWQRNGVDVPGATRPLLVFSSPNSDDAGEYRAIVTAGSATYQSNVVTFAVTPNTSRLANFSARSRVQPGETPQIAGFVTTHATPQPVLLRAIGPSLAGHGVAEPLLRDPLFQLFEGPAVAQESISAWDPTVRARSEQVGAFALLDPGTPPAFTERGIATDLASGLFTAQTTASGADDGVSLFEFYDASSGSGPDFVRNVSLRGRTAPGAETMIGGFILAGNGPRTLLLRAVGPELAQWDVPESLVDPQLTLYSSIGIVTTSDNWTDLSGGSPEAITNATTATGAFPLDPTSTSAAILVTLPPGAYTLHATGANATAGEVLLEIYTVEN